MSKKISYNEALEEIQLIVSNIENDQYGIDELAEKVKRVSALANICKEKLRTAEEEINSIIEENKD